MKKYVLYLFFKLYYEYVRVLKCVFYIIYERFTEQERLLESWRLSKCRIEHIIVVLAIKYYVEKCDYVDERLRDILTKRQER